MTHEPSRRHAALRPALVSALMLALAACSQQQPPPRAAEMQRSTSVEVPMDIVTERVKSKLEELGFEIEASGGGIVRAGRLGSPAGGFASCKPIRVVSRTGGESQRFRSAQPFQEQVRLIARISQIGAVTNVALEPLMIGIYENSFTARQIEEKCPSNGSLEKSVLTSIEQLGPVPGAKDAG